MMAPPRPAVRVIAREEAVLVALDGGPDAGPQLVAAQRIGALLGLPVRALHIRTAGIAVPEYVVDSGVTLYVRDGDPGVQVTQAASAPDIAALVLGAGGGRDDTGTAGGRDDRPLGATARVAAASLPKPVVFVPPGASAERADRVLIPLDGTPETSRASDPWVELALDAGMEVTAVHVLTAEHLPAFNGLARQGRPARADEFLRRYCPAGAGLVDLVTRVGSAEEVVPSVAWEYGADLVVIGWSRCLAPGRARLVRALLAHSPAPVILVTVPVAPVLLDEAPFPRGAYRSATRGRLQLGVDRGYLGRNWSGVCDPLMIRWLRASRDDRRRA